MIMLLVSIAIIVIVFVVSLLEKKNIEETVKNIILTNIIIILSPMFLSLLVRINNQTGFAAELFPNFNFWGIGIVAIINILIIIFNKRIVRNKIFLSVIIIIYFIAMYIIPSYKIQMVYDKNKTAADYVDLEEHITYYNGYGVELYSYTNRAKDLYVH